jgi:threonine dehydrogenase-like Zn-dependent dehydrogenase
MRAARITAPRRIEIGEVALPRPGPSQVRVRLEGCGVCGSNLAVWQGRPWFEYPFEPGAPGHEGWGTVDELGPRVKHVRVGDRVALLSYHAYAEYDLADCGSITPAPSESAVFPGEALGCALNVFDRSDIRGGDTVAIIGIGFLGALLVQIVARRGARVIAITRRPFALDIARRFGATETVALGQVSEAVARIMDLTQGRGCERVIEAAGEQGALDLASELVCVRGRLIIAGYHQDVARRVNMQLWNWRGIDIVNAHERDPREYLKGMKAAAADVARGALEPASLYTHSFALEELHDAFTALERRPDQFLKAWIRTNA